MLKLIAILVAALAAPALAAVPTVSVVNQTVNETAGTATVRIIRTGDLSKPSQIGFKTINGTALAGVNFTYRSGGVWFPALTNSYRFTVPILVDHKVTPDLKFTVRLTAVLNAQLLGGTITIHNTDQPPPPPPPPPVQCPDGTTVPAGQTCPTPPPPTDQWVSAPLQDGSFARVKANDSTWDMTGPGPSRPLVPGEIVAVYFNGWGFDADSSASFAIYALSDKTSGRAKAVDLEGVAPIGTPPGLPADWWVPGLVTAAKTCTDPRQGHEGQPGVTQGGTYRAAMVAGSHMKLATGQTGDAGAMWQVFGSGDQNSPASATFTVVTGDCLTGQ